MKHLKITDSKMDSILSDPTWLEMVLEGQNELGTAIDIIKDVFHYTYTSTCVIDASKRLVEAAHNYDQQRLIEESIEDKPKDENVISLTPMMLEIIQKSLKLDIDALEIYANEFLHLFPERYTVLKDVAECSLDGHILTVKFNEYIGRNVINAIDESTQFFLGYEYIVNRSHDIKHETMTPIKWDGTILKFYSF